MIGPILLGVSILTGALGQILFKKGVDGISAEGINFYLEMFRNIWIILGGVAYGVSFILWMQVLKIYDVSFARPITAAGYIVTYILAIAFLGESFTWQRLLGTALVTAGVFLMR
ncbi:MAG: hypothetical protein A2Y33_13130 [Spirochaetes bacterium GWF1_51_8]|nr:MAG: hypothetical protein A2Y33_13130 [Spirochaetes bacterium GWF1_51_8]